MKFNENQKQAINKTNGNVAVIATAGSGKTAVIVNRIKRLVTECNIPADNILAVTFSRKARENIQNRIGEDCKGVNIETFHSIALKIIQDYSNGAYVMWLKSWEKEKCLFNICRKMKLCDVKEDFHYNELLRFIAVQKTNMRESNNLIYDANIPYTVDVMKAIFEEYEEYKRNHSYVEFDDLLNMVCDIFNDNNDFLRKYQRKYKYILADEFQDVCLNQAIFLKYLSQNNNLFVVGDGCQAIYKFRGGMSKYLLDFDTEWKNADIINLNMNYRCSKDIVTTANKLAQFLPESKNKHYVEAVANRPCTFQPEYVRCLNARDEAKIIARKIKELVKQGYEYKDIAILSRTNAQLQYFESEFCGCKIPYVTFSNNTFIDNPEIRLVLSYIRLAFKPDSDEDFKYVYNKPYRWLDRKFLPEVCELAKRNHCSLYSAMFSVDRRNWKFKNGINELYRVVNVLQNKKFLNVGEAVKTICKELDIDNYVTKGKFADDGNCVEQIENLDTFQSICCQFTSYDELEYYLSNIKENNYNLDDNRVNIMTLHKSKGLEFPVVFIVGCSVGLLPHIQSNDIDDEKRLMYVGITRAMDRLYLSSVQSYNSRNLMVSPFISMLGNTIKKL